MPVVDIQVAVTADPLFGENGCVVFERDGGPCWIVDPSFDPQPGQIAQVVAAHSLRPTGILITHCHGDHIIGIDAIKARWPQAELVVPAAEVDCLTDPVKNLSAAFGMPLRVAARTDRAIRPADRLQLDATDWQALDVSGHSPGGTAYYCPAGKVVITGDALFAGSVGRTDFPGADQAKLLAHIRANLLSLPDDVVVYPGHGPRTTIGQERKTNPFLQ